MNPGPFLHQHRATLNAAGATDDELRRLAESEAWTWAEEVFFEQPDEIHFWQSDPARLAIWFPGMSTQGWAYAIRP